MPIFFDLPSAVQLIELFSARTCENNVNEF